MLKWHEENEPLRAGRFPCALEVTAARIHQPSLVRRRSDVFEGAAVPRRCGLTLVELLVVITILVLLMAAMVPLLQTVSKGREVREAARQLSVFFSRAQNRSSQTGREVGVWFERDANNSNASWRMSLCEVPPPYAGDTMESEAYLVTDSSGMMAQFDLTRDFRLDPGFKMDGRPFVAPGDTIQFRYTGPRYQLVSASKSGTTVIWKLSLPQTQVHQMPAPTPPATAGYGVPYQIFRRPQRSAVATLTLPASTAVDLYWSGTDGVMLTGFRTAQGVQEELVVMFNPDGGLGHFYKYGSGSKFPPEGNLYFLVGRLDQVGTSNSQGLTNLNDADNLWLTVNTRGLVTTAQNIGLQGLAQFTGQTQPTQIQQVQYARQLARGETRVGGA